MVMTSSLTLAVAVSSATQATPAVMCGIAGLALGRGGNSRPAAWLQSRAPSLTGPDGLGLTNQAWTRREVCEVRGARGA